MMLRHILFAIFISLFFLSNAFADIICLKNGNKVTGIITKETDDFIEIKINIGAIVKFSRKDIERVKKDGDTHTRIESDWEVEKTRREARKIARGNKKSKEVSEGSEIANIVEKAGRGYAERKFIPGRDKSKRSSFSKKLLSKGDWLMKETEHFSIIYTDLEQAKIVSDKAEYYFEKIVYDLGYEDEINWDDKCRVYIIESVERWKSFLKEVGFNAELVGGFVPNYGEKEMYLCALSDGYLALTFPHELTHLIFNDVSGGKPIPLWLNEGLANYEASVTSISNKLLVKRINQGRYILLGDLLRMTTYPEGKETRELFYAQSEKMVEFLITQYGRKKFREFCDMILKDMSFRDSLFEAYKNDFKDIEDFNVNLIRYIIE